MTKSKKLNVIYFPAWFPSEQNPLAGKFLFEQAKALEENVAISIVYIDANEHLKKLFVFSYSDAEDFEIVKLSFKKITNRFFSPINAILYAIGNIYLLFKERKRYKSADINHVHVLTRTALLPYLIKIFYNIPYVISEHWSRYLPENNTYHGFFRKLVTKFFIKKSNGIATVSNALKQAMMKYGISHKNFPVISNTLDTSKYLPVMLKKEDTFLVLHVSGLNDGVKNVTGILRAAKILFEEKYNFNLVIIGDDDLEGPVIRKYAEDLGLANVKFTGKLYGNDLIAYYQKADVFVLNSNFETQGIVVLEAMSCGLPVIATSVGGVKEIMTSDTGILINAKDDKMLAQAMAKVIVGEVNFDKEKIRKHAVANYSYASIASAIINFYKVAIEAV